MRLAGMVRLKMRRLDRTPKRRTLCAALLASAFVCLSVLGVAAAKPPGQLRQSAATADPVEQMCAKVATQEPEINRLEFTNAWYRKIPKNPNRYPTQDFYVNGYVVPWPSSCVGVYKRVATARIQVQLGTNHSVWLSRHTRSLRISSPYYNEGGGCLDAGAKAGRCFFAYLDGWGVIPALYSPPNSNVSVAKQRRKAWRIVIRAAVYACSNRKLRPPMLRTRRSTRGTTHARWILQTGMTDVASGQVVARQSYRMPLRVTGPVGAC